MRHIELTQNQVAVVDDEDYESICENQWYVQKIRDVYYAARRLKKQKIIYMHRLILENKLGRTLGENEFVDHINGDGLDNRTSNLRSCDNTQNCANSTKQKTYGGKNTTSKYKGVSWDKSYEKWKAQIGFNNKVINLGRFQNESEAAKAYDKAALKYFGEFARINSDDT